MIISYTQHIRTLLLMETDGVIQMFMPSLPLCAYAFFTLLLLYLLELLWQLRQLINCLNKHINKQASILVLVEAYILTFKFLVSHKQIWKIVVHIQGEKASSLLQFRKGDHTSSNTVFFSL